MPTSELAGVNRRQWLTGWLQTATAFALLPELSGAEGRTPAPWKPRFLTHDQNESLTAIGERIIPGSATAGCNRVIDAVLSIEDEKTRRQFAAALASFDRVSQQQYGEIFGDLDASRQDDLLRAAVVPDSALHTQFTVLKEWMADTYWTSEQGLRELGWTGRVAWPSFDGCQNGVDHGAG